MTNGKKTVSSMRPRGRQRRTKDVTVREAFDKFGDSVLVQLMKASGRYDSLYRLTRQPEKKEPNTCVSNRSGVC